jgi:hypothetical protein
MSRITKPCPGCHTTEHRRSSADSVCWNCEKAIAEGRRSWERNSEKDDLLTVGIPFGFYGLPYLGDEGRAVQEAFFNLLMMLKVQSDGRGCERVYLLQSEDRHSCETAWVTLKRRHLQILEKLYQSIIDLRKGSEKEGREEGQSLLLQLANGQLSLDDFDKSTTGYARRVQEAAQSRKARRKHIAQHRRETRRKESSV